MEKQIAKDKTSAEETVCKELYISLLNDVWEELMKHSKYEKHEKIIERLWFEKLEADKLKEGKSKKKKKNN